MKKNISDGPGSFTNAGIKSTQRKWVKYRDSWVKFAAARYPQVKVDILKTWLTEKRAAELKDFLPSEKQNQL